MNRLYVRCVKCNTGLIDAICPKCQMSKLKPKINPCKKSINGTCNSYQLKNGIEWCLPYNCPVDKINFNCD